jgi:hypothetical protein
LCGGYDEFFKSTVKPKFVKMAIVINSVDDMAVTSSSHKMRDIMSGQLTIIPVGAPLTKILNRNGKICKPVPTFNRGQSIAHDMNGERVHQPFIGQK